jgi:sRNA-binding carbon storage regulator CsrA
MLKITRTARPDAGDKGVIDIADGLIRIRVDRVQGNQVHVSIEAPRDIKIMRAELLQSAPIFKALHASPSAQKVNDVY